MTSGLRVLHVDPERGFSGGESQVLGLVRHLAARGFLQTVATPSDGALADRIARADDLVERAVEVMPLRCRRDLDPIAGLALRRTVRARPVDIVHLHTGRALTLAPYLPRDAQRPAIVVTRRMDYPPRGLRPYVRWLYGRADAVIAISRAVRAALLARGVDEGEISVVPSGIDVTRFAALDRGAARSALGCSGDRGRGGVVGIVATLHARKGHAVLLEAVARLAANDAPPLLLVAGGGPAGHELMDLSRRLGIARSVRWLGQLEDPRVVLAAADVIAVPSLAEGLGVAAIEAMAAGRPLVASAVGGLVESVRNGVEGLLVPPGDAAALATALESILRSPELASRLAAAGQARAQHFSLQAMAEGTAAVYERALTRARK